MPLTPEDVSNKRFTPVRLREGYDMGEVDQFLDEVESELSRLTRDNDELRSQLAAAQNGGGASHPATSLAETPTGAVHDGEPQTPAQPEPATESKPEVALGVAEPVETLKVTTVADASSAAVRLLEIATRNAGELVGEAKEEAERILAEARANAEQLDAESRANAERLETDSRTRAQQLDAETDERRAQLFGDLEKEREGLSGEVDNLRTFEREYRARLKSYFHQQLAALDGAGESASLDGAGEPQPRSRLKALLGDDGDKQA